MAEKKECKECPFFEWFEGGIDAGWCGMQQQPAKACNEACADNPQKENNG